MAIIQDLHLFSWKTFQDDLQTLGDLEKFKLVIETMPDGKLIETLETLRANGRNDHPVKVIWNSLLAGIVFEHASIESLRRELKRNAQLREMCGFGPLLGAPIVRKILCLTYAALLKIAAMIVAGISSSMIFWGFSRSVTRSNPTRARQLFLFGLGLHCGSTPKSL